MKKVELIGGRLDGACASVEDDMNEVTLHEMNSISKQRTGKHFVYIRKDKKRFTFSRSYLDGKIVEMADGPVKGTQLYVENADVCILIRCPSGIPAAYVRDGDAWKYEKSFKSSKEAEDFAEAYTKARQASGSQDKQRKE